MRREIIILPGAIDLDNPKDGGMLLHGGGPEKGMLSRVQVPLGMQTWLKPPRMLPVPAKGIAEGERNLEWIVEEGEDEYQL